MAFLSGANEDIFAHRLKRSASIDRNLRRSRAPSTSTSASSPSVPRSESFAHSPETPSRSRRPSTATAQASSPFSSGLVHSSAALHSNTTRPHTSSGHTDARLGSFATPSPASSSSRPRVAHRAIHHAASFSALDDDRRPCATQSTKTTPSSGHMHRQPGGTSSSPSTRAVGHQIDPFSGSMSDPPSTSRPRLRLAPADTRGNGPPISPSRNGSASDGGVSSDRSPAAHLDVKRLLSKPAPSRASVYSVTSDSDSPAAEILRSHSPSSLSTLSAPWLGFSGGSPRLAPPTSRFAAVGTASSSRSSSADRTFGHENRSPCRASPIPLSPSKSLPSSKPSPSSTSKLSSTTPRPSPASSRPSLGMSGQSPISPKSAPPVSKPSPVSRPAIAILPDRPPDGGKEQEKDRPRLLRKRSRGGYTGQPPPKSPTGPSLTVKRAGTNPTGAPPPSPKLTPAGAIAEAYKAQDVRRETLAATARGEALSPVPPETWPRRPVTDPEDSPDSSQPYYTVFGSPVTIAADEDGAWTTVSANTDAQPRPARRSLVRKVSGRFSRHKLTPSTAAGISELPAILSVKSRSSSSQASGEPQPRKSLQERRSTSLPVERRRSLRISLDGRMDNAGEFGEVKRKVERKEGGDTRSGGRLWKLVKRLSSNKLSDKYHARTGGSGDGTSSSGGATPASPPPVPAIPKDLLQMAAPQLGDNSPTPRASQPRSSRSAQSSPAFAEPRGRRPSTATGLSGPSPASGRRSMTTRSSSPSSFFRPPSPRSSASSFGDEIPPVPSGAKRVLSPRARRRDPGGGADDPFVFTPSPGADDGEQRPPSPDMPVFATHGSVNNFAERKRLLSAPVLFDAAEWSIGLGLGLAAAGGEGGASGGNTPPPPPRPTRSPNRPATIGPGMISPASPRSPSPARSPAPATPATPATPALALGRRKSRYESLVRRESDDINQGPSSESGHSTATVTEARPARATFREMGARPTAARTEQEKDRMWDDLLERSALAGGTLHLGGASLMSDTLRFSTISSSSSLSA